MPVTARHSLTMTTPVDTRYENTPADWNRDHVVTLSADGAEIVGAFSNANGLSFGLSAGQVTGSYTVPSVAGLVSAVNVSAGTTSNNLSALTFNNGNNVTFGLNGSVITASVNSSYRASNDAIGLNTAQSNVTWTVNSSGLSLDARGYAGTATGFTGANISGSITNNSNGLSLSLSVAPGGGGADGYNILAAGTQTANTTGTVVFSNSNGLTFGMSNNSVITGSYTVPTQTNQTIGGYFVGNTTGQSSSSVADARSISIDGAGIVSAGWSNGSIRVSATQSNQAVSAANGSYAFQTLSFSNANGVSFGTSAGSAVTASYTVPTVTDYFSKTNTTFNGANISGSLTLNTNGLQVSLSVAPGGGGADGYNILAAGTQTANTTGTVSFANSNGISFGMSNSSVITASYTVPTQTNQTIGGYFVGNTTGQSSSSVVDARSISIDGAGIVSAGWSAGSIRISATQSNQAVSAANGSYAFQTLSFSNANGMSFGTSAGSALTGSYTVPSVTEYFSKTNTTFNGANISGSLTLNTNGLELSLSVAPGGGGADGYNILAAGTQTANTTGTVVFANSNGLSFGMSNSSVITASYTVPAQTNQTVGGYAVGNTTGQSSSSTIDARSISIDGAGLISVGWSNGTLRVSGTQSNQAWSGSNASSTFQTLSFGNANGASWSNNGGAINLSYTVPTVTNSSMTVSDAGTSGTLARLAFTNLNGVTLSLSTGAGGSHTIVGSHNALTSQSNQNITAANGGFAFQTLSFSNANGISFGTSAGSAITASHNALTTARASNDAVGLNTAQTNVTWTVNSSGLSLNAAGYAGTGTSATNASITLNSNGLAISVGAGGGGVTPVASASNGSFSFTTLGFSNANNVTFGTSAGSIITASVAAPGAAAENNAINLLGANTAGNTTATGSTIGWSGINLTLSGTNNSIVNISAPATSSLSATGIVSISTNGSTISIGVPAGTATMWQPFNEGMNVVGQQGQGTLHIVPLPTPTPGALGEVQIDRVCFPVQASHATNSTGSVTLSLWMGLYTRNNSSLSLAHSQSFSTNWTFSGTANSSVLSGLRLISGGWTTTFGDGRYYVGLLSRTTSGGANCTISQLLVSQMASNFSGFVGQATNKSYQWPLGFGVYSASLSSLPASFGFSDINGTGSVGARPPSWFMIKGTA